MLHPPSRYSVIMYLIEQTVFCKVTTVSLMLVAISCYI